MDTLKIRGILDMIIKYAYDNLCSETTKLHILWYISEIRTINIVLEVLYLTRLSEHKSFIILSVYNSFVR